MRTLKVLLLLTVIYQDFDRSETAFAVPEGVVKVQFSPRLLYRRKEGQLPVGLSPVGLVRILLNKLNLEHLKYKLIQAIALNSNELLFEMETYLLALEIVRAWNAQIEENELNAFAAEESDCNSVCVNNEFELTRTEMNFFKDPQIQLRQA